MEDRLILDGLMNGDQQAFNALVVKYWEPMVAEAHHILRNWQDAEDIVQELLIKLNQKRNWKIDKSLKSYLALSAQNAAKYKLKTGRSSARLTICWDPFNFFVFNIIDEENLSGEDQQKYRDLFNERLNALEQSKRQALTFKYYKIDGLSRKETAKKMGISEESVKTNMKEVMRKLRGLPKALLLIGLFIM